MVSCGAAFGANSRFIIYKKLEKINVSKNTIILIINSFSAFCLGFFLSMIDQIGFPNFSYRLVLFFLIGFLGSLSTFSTLVYDLYELILKIKYLRALRLFIISLALGVTALAIGLFLGNL